MAGSIYLPWLLTCASLISSCHGQDNMVTVLKKLRQFEEDLLESRMDLLRTEKKVLDTIHEFLPKKAGAWNRDNPSDICIRDNDRLETELRESKDYAADLKTRNEQLEHLNNTCKIQLSRLKTELEVTTSSKTTQHGTSTVTLPVSTTPVLIPRAQEVKSRILIAPVWSSNPHQFRQLNIHGNSLSIYQYHTMREVTSVIYATKTKKLLIGLSRPDKIVSSTLDTRHMSLLADGVRTHGMAVDYDRDIVFVGTTLPRSSISRMSTQGKDFTTITNLSEYGSPRQITLDTKRRRMYWCTGYRLFTVAYDGQDLTKLAGGGNINAVTLDQAAGVLYYGIETKLMKMTLSSNVSTEVTTLNARPYNMGLYRGTIYYSGYRSPIVGAVDVTNNTVAYTLQSVSLKGANTYCMCLVP